MSTPPPALALPCPVSPSPGLPIPASLASTSGAVAALTADVTAERARADGLASALATARAEAAALRGDLAALHAARASADGAADDSVRALGDLLTDARERRDRVAADLLAVTEAFDAWRRSQGPALEAARRDADAARAALRATVADLRRAAGEAGLAAPHATGAGVGAEDGARDGSGTASATATATATGTGEETAGVGGQVDAVHTLDADVTAARLLVGTLRARVRSCA